MTILDKIPVRLPEVELVRLDFLWQHAEALFIEFQLHGEVGRFVVGVPTEMVDVGVTVHDAGANLRTELDLGLRLAPDNRTEVRLVDADDAVGLAQTRETLKAQTARDCGIGSSISCRFLLILTPKGNHFL